MAEMDIIKFAKDVLGVELLPYQEDMLRKLEEGTLILSKRTEKGLVYRVWDKWRTYGTYDG